MNGSGKNIQRDSKHEEKMPTALLASFLGFAVGFLGTALLIAVRFMESS
jgi:hypothetical protein